MGVIFTFVGPPFFDDQELFLSPEHAATHAIMVQGGFSTPEIEAQRMAKATNPKVRAMGEQWLHKQANPYPITDHRYKRDSSKQGKICGTCGSGPELHASAGSRVPKETNA